MITYTNARNFLKKIGKAFVVLFVVLLIITPILVLFTSSAPRECEACIFGKAETATYSNISYNGTGNMITTKDGYTIACNGTQTIRIVDSTNGAVMVTPVSGGAAVSTYSYEYYSVNDTINVTRKDGSVYICNGTQTFKSWDAKDGSITVNKNGNKTSFNGSYYPSSTYRLVFEDGLADGDSTVYVTGNISGEYDEISGAFTTFDTVVYGPSVDFLGGLAETGPWSVYYDPSISPVDGSLDLESGMFNMTLGVWFDCPNLRRADNTPIPMIEYAWGTLTEETKKSSFIGSYYPSSTYRLVFEDGLADGDSTVYITGNFSAEYDETSGAFTTFDTVVYGPSVDFLGGLAETGPWSIYYDPSISPVDGSGNPEAGTFNMTLGVWFDCPNLRRADNTPIPMIEHAYWTISPVGGVGERNLPADALNVDAEYPGDTFDVYVNFTAPADDFAGIGLTDLAPAGWDVATDVSWCDPEASWTMSPGNKVEYAWSGPFSEGQNFTARYKVTIPATASPGINEWPNGEIDKAWLEYYVGAEGPFKWRVTGDWQKIVTVPGCVVGETRDVNADLLTTTLVVLSEQPPEIGDEPEDSDSSTAPDAIYKDDVNDTGQYWLQASKYCYFPLDTNAMPGTRNPNYPLDMNFTTPELLAEGFTMDFEGDYGLVPKACSMGYAMESVNHWLFVPVDGMAVPHPEWQLSNWKAMESVHSWQFPCGCNA